MNKLHDAAAFNEDPPPFWRQFKFFFAYLQQEKLYYQITLLAFANVLLSIPIPILTLLIAGMLFLASYKLAFEVLHTVSSGQFVYADGRSHEIDDKIGFKAVVMGVLQLLIYIFVYRSNPTVGLALLILTTVATPAYLMMLSKTQDILISLNPFNLMTVMSRIGFEYVLLVLFFLLCAAFNLAFRYYAIDLLPGLIGDVITAWVLYFLLMFTFAVIGYVMYRHADDLGHDTIDTEVTETQSTYEVDPIKERIKDLIAQNKGQEAAAIIKELKNEDGRTDLDAYLSQAESLLVHEQRQRPVTKAAHLIDKQQHKDALALFLEYLEDGHFIKLENPNQLSQLIQYAFDKNQYKTVLRLCQGFDKRYPDAHQDTVDNYFLVAKIYYQHKKPQAAIDLLQSLIKKYAKSAQVSGPSSYLKGIRKLHKN